jgi:ABC-2 type transport system permease protein
MWAGATTNIVFGFLRCYIMLAVTDSNGGKAGGYHTDQIITYVWVTQGLIATVGLWADTGLSDRIRTGDVVADLLRPVPTMLNYLAVDLGRAGFAALTRLVLPVVTGALFFDMYAPHRPATYPLFLLSIVLATLTCFGCRYAINATSYWLLYGRGPMLAWVLASGVLTGLYFPLSFLPGWLYDTLWLATPFPSCLQAPSDVLVEKYPLSGQLGALALQAVWALAMLGAAAAVQRAGERRLVVQGG